MYGERELSQLIATIATINAWNRFGVSTRKVARALQGGGLQATARMTQLDPKVRDAMVAFGAATRKGLGDPVLAELVMIRGVADQ